MLAPVADRERHWIDRTPAWLRPYGVLARVDRPIGFWLLFWPCAWGIAAAPGAPDPAALFALMAGAFLMRGAGCTVNDLADRRYDAMVERTKNRPLASGALSPKQALVFLALQIALAATTLLLLDQDAAILAVLALPLVAAYPLMKRITWWPQAFLGITFNWGALVGWTHQAGELQAPALILWAAGFFWTLGYDTIYAHQDKEDDALIGVRSSARRLGERSPPFVAAFYAAALCCLIAVALWTSAGPSFYLALPLLAAALFGQLRGWNMDEPGSSLSRFRFNHYVGGLVFVALLLGKWGG